MTRYITVLLVFLVAVHIASGRTDQAPIKTGNAELKTSSFSLPPTSSDPQPRPPKPLAQENEQEQVQTTCEEKAQRDERQANSLLAALMFVLYIIGFYVFFRGIAASAPLDL